MENEICPVVLGSTDELPKPNPEEVASYQYLDWAEFLNQIQSPDSDWSEWCVEEAQILNQNPYFKNFYSNLRQCPKIN